MQNRPTDGDGVRQTTGLQRISVAIVDDSIPLQKRLAELIPQDGSAEVIAFAATVFDAVQLVWDRSPDVVVLDFQLKEGTALDVLDGIQDKVPYPTVIVLTNYPEPIYRAKCLEAGAYRFLDKSTEFSRLTETIREISMQIHQGGPDATGSERTG